MGGRSRTLLAWSLWLGTFACLIGGLVVTLAVTRPLTTDVLADGAFEGAIWLLFATVGLVLTLRRPENPIGWLDAAAGLVFTVYVPSARGSTGSCWRAGRSRRPPRRPPWPRTACGRPASPWPSPCPCCCCRTGGCARPAGGRSWPSWWSGRP
jgi:hypothetical protein